MAQRCIKGKFDLSIIGGGIVGLATARQVLIRHPKLKVCVIEKESELAQHQSKRNSGVVHHGIYYKKGSLKSKLCIKGAKMVRDYCQEKGLPYKRCGKLIVATQSFELETLHNLYKNATTNRINGIELVNKRKVMEIQPGCTTAVEAIWSPDTAIVDWHQVALSYARDFEQIGGKIYKNYTAYLFDTVDDSLLIHDAKHDHMIETKSAVNCAGVYSDYFARLTKNNEHPKVVPFKGNYFLLSDRLARTIKTNVYPVPNPDLPFLGVHITPRIDGSVIIGPTSLLTLGYERYKDESIRLVHLYHILYRSGLFKLIRKKGMVFAGTVELWRRLSKGRVVTDVREFLPEVKKGDLIETDFCGIRAQALDKDGTLVDDFLFETGVDPSFNRVLHVRNCPSPAATSSLAIAERIVDILEERLI